MSDNLSPIIGPLANWTAANAFKEACEAADEAHALDGNHREAVCRALCITLSLIEHWRGEHKEEITAYLGDKAPKDGKDNVLAIVKCVFARQDKRQWTWHANALKQAIAKERTPDDVAAYFQKTPPTQAAKEWSKAQNAGKPKPQFNEVEIGPITLPGGQPFKLDKEQSFKLKPAAGNKLILCVPKPKPPQSTANTSQGRTRSSVGAAP